jgi:hypothetical protein
MTSKNAVFDLKFQKELKSDYNSPSYYLFDIRVDFSFLLVYTFRTAELYVTGPRQSEIKYGTIFLTEEIKKLDGRIITCRYFDHQWIFCAQRHDRNHPNGRRAIKGTTISPLHFILNCEVNFLL